MKPNITIGITFILMLISLAAGAEPEILSVTPRLIAQSGRQFSVAIDVQIQNDWHINSNNLTINFSFRPRYVSHLPTRTRSNALHSRTYLKTLGLFGYTTGCLRGYFFRSV
jgi:hypothetical protein